MMLLSFSVLNNSHLWHFFCDYHRPVHLSLFFFFLLFFFQSNWLVHTATNRGHHWCEILVVRTLLQSRCCKGDQWQEAHYLLCNTKVNHTVNDYKIRSVKRCCELRLKHEEKFCSQNEKILTDITVPFGVLTAEEGEELLFY